MNYKTEKLVALLILLAISIYIRIPDATLIYKYYTGQFRMHSIILRKGQIITMKLDGKEWKQLTSTSRQGTPTEMITVEAR